MFDNEEECQMAIWRVHGKYTAKQVSADILPCGGHVDKIGMER